MGSKLFIKKWTRKFSCEYFKGLKVQDSKTYRKYLGMNTDTFEVVWNH